MFASNTSQVSSDATYIEDVFSTWLYTGAGGSESIPNGIDLSGKGGMVWIKNRGAIRDHVVFDTARGQGKFVYPNLTDAQVTYPSSGGPQFGSNGFSFTSLYSDGLWNGNNETYASWTFRKQPKFFDVVTYTGNGANRTIPHNLGSVPGCIIVKSTSNTSNWAVYHRSLTDSSYYLVLNSTSQEASNTAFWNSTAPTATEFSLGTVGTVNGNGLTYVAYLFAHNAGGFGLTGTDNVISCGSFTTDGSGVFSVNLGYEPQWIMFKRTDGTGNWLMFDNMRGMPVGGNEATLRADLSDAETSTADFFSINATGFGDTTGTLGASRTFIYIAIRRGPMKTPTTGTSVFALSTWTGSAGNKDLGTQTNNFGTGYFAMLKTSSSYAQAWGQFDQLRGATSFLSSNNTAVESADPGGISVVNGRLQLNSNSYFGAGGDGDGAGYIGQFFRRAPGFFDVVCYTGTGSARTVTHNLGVAPELMMVKRRDTTGTWIVYSAATGATNYLILNAANSAAPATSAWNDTAPTSSVFTVGTSSNVNASGGTYVAYLFASVAGVSKVGSYTGTGATQTINCGFTGGARFVLIKRTDGSEDWYVWDTARGMVAGTDPYLLLDTTGAEVNTNLVYTTSVGFQVVGTGTNVNASGGTYLYLAIA